jgi:hypothetical protein
MKLGTVYEGMQKMRQVRNEIRENFKGAKH